MTWCRGVSKIRDGQFIALTFRSPGHPDYGCFISKDKSLVNFDHPSLPNIVDPRSQGAPNSSRHVSHRLIFPSLSVVRILN